MPKIVVTQRLNLNPLQIQKLESLGSLRLFEDPTSPKDWLKRCTDADIICSKALFMQTEVYKLKNKFFSLPLVGHSWLDMDKLKKRNIIVSNCPGCNKYAVSEWILGMTLNLTRNLHQLALTNSKKLIDIPGASLRGKKIIILGMGNIGLQTAKLLRPLGAKISFFKKDDDLYKKTKSADIIINCLSTNPTTINLLNDKFFNNLKKGSYFISITTDDIYDSDALFHSLKNKILAGAAIDCGSADGRDHTNSHYLKLNRHPKIIATPHIAFYADSTFCDANDIMIENIEAWIKNKPINLI